MGLCLRRAETRVPHIASQGWSRNVCQQWRYTFPCLALIFIRRTRMPSGSVTHLTESYRLAMLSRFLVRWGRLGAEY
jgi:hypothetical protein